MKRRTLLACAGGSGFALSFPLVAKAQGTKTFRIGVLVSGSPPHPVVAAVRVGLESFGYVHGRNLALDVRYAEGKFESAIELAKELVGLKVDTIVVHFTPAAIAAKRATSTIPIVMAPVGAPLQTGLVQSLARPGGNVTGLSAMAAELGSKRIELLRRALPDLARVAVLGATTDPFTTHFVKDIEGASKRAGLTLTVAMANGPSELERAFGEMAAARVQAVIVQPIFDSQRTSIVALATQHKIALMSNDRSTVLAGGLMSFWVDEIELYKRAPVFIDKILKGARPADLPVEQPNKFVLAVNIKAAQSLNITLPDAILTTADEVIE